MSLAASPHLAARIFGLKETSFKVAAPSPWTRAKGPFYLIFFVLLSPFPKPGGDFRDSESHLAWHRKIREVGVIAFPAVDGLSTDAQVVGQIGYSDPRLLI